ncbi:hypothetical protein Bbelb_062040 [Branchiostoma belcheri]|nr:hypothetical protein Bbelb_062040 [Branchiostoma belcheri]
MADCGVGVKSDQVPCATGRFETTDGLLSSQGAIELLQAQPVYPDQRRTIQPPLTTTTLSHDPYSCATVGGARLYLTPSNGHNVERIALRPVQSDVLRSSGRPNPGTRSVACLEPGTLSSESRTLPLRHTTPQKSAKEASPPPSDDTKEPCGFHGYHRARLLIARSQPERDKHPCLRGT